jgi:Flp pilus assembly pilin Flp
MIQLLKNLLKRQDGQDLVEYALMAATVAVAAGAIFPPGIMPAVSTIFSKITSTMGLAPG